MSHSRQINPRASLADPLSKTEGAAAVALHRVVRRRWTVTFETGSVTFTTALDLDEAFVIRWARKAQGVPQSEKVTRVTCEPPNNVLSKSPEIK